MSEPVSTSESVDRATGPIADALRSLRARAKAQLFVQRSGFIAATAVAIACVLGYLDFALRFPSAVRWAFWIIGLSALAGAIVRGLLPVLRFRPTLTEIALRIERSPEGRGLSGVLASGIELAQRSGEGELTKSLAGIAAREAVDRFGDGIPVSRLMNPARLLRALGVLVLAGLPVVTTVALAPSHARTGSMRILAPWAGAVWDRRTRVIDAGAPVAHPAGQALPLRALLTRSTRDADATDVRAVFRVFVNGEAGAPQRMPLASQHRRAKADTIAGAPPEEGALFERLVDITSLLPAGVTTRDKVEFEYSFETEDDATEPWRVLIVEPPAIRSAEISVSPPAYLASLVPLATADAGSGRDSRGALGPYVAGSRIRLTIKLNKPLPVDANAADTPGSFLATRAPALAEQDGLNVTAADELWTIEWTAKQTVRAAFQLVDEFGIRSIEESVFRVDVVEDRPASALVIEPPQDESILPTAVLPITAEGRDDVGVSEVALLRQIARKPPDSEGAAPEALGAPEPLTLTKGDPASTTPSLELRASSVLTITELGVQPGDEVWVTGEVKDLLAAHAGGAAVRSPTRRLRIISETTFAEQIQAELSSVREAAKRLALEQTRLASSRPKALAERQEAREQIARQDAIGDRLQPMTDTVERLTSRVARNNPEDSSISQLLDDLKAAAGEAAESSDLASKELESLSRREEDQASPEQQEKLESAQRDAEEKLDEIVKMLERGRDGWAARRSLERLITEQKQVADQTRAAGQESQGKTADQLTPQQRDERNRIAQKQQELSQRTRAVIDTLEEQAQQMQQADPGLSQSMQKAAEKGRKELVPQLQESAAQQVQENKTGAAQRQQEQAAQSLEEMLGELEKAEQRRDEALRRTIAELNQSLQRLVAQQTTELERLAAEARGSAQADLDKGMIAINRGTAAAQELVNAMSESGRLPELLDSASNAQSAAISLLRANPRDLAEADSNERRSLTRLKEAIEELAKLDEAAAERESDRAKEELAKAYAKALEQQAAINAGADPMIGKPVGRRERAALRALGDAQDELRAMLDELRTKTDGLDDAKVFDYAHKRLDQSMTNSVTLLRAGTATKPLARDLAASLRVLGALVEALKNSPKDDDELKDEEAGDDGGGGGGGPSGQEPLLPPGTELKLLRMMQEEAMERTRSLGDTPDADPDELAAVSKLQSDLHARAQELLESLQQEADQPQVQPEPAPPAEPAPEDPS